MRRPTLPLVLFMVAGCQPATMELTEERMAGIADTVQQLSLEYLAAVSTLDTDSVMSFHIDSDEFAWSIDAQLFPDLASLAESTRVKYAAIAAASVSLDTVEVAVLGPDAAVLSGRGTAFVTDRTGHHMALRLAVTFVGARRNGRWVLLQGHSSHAPAEST